MKRPIHVLLILGLLGPLGIAEEVAHAADPTIADCLSASESSITLRNQHKLGDARTQLLRCSAASCPAEVRDECVRRVGEVNAAIPTVVFEAKDASGNDLVPVDVKMDGKLIAERLDGTALSIDPGEHAFTFASAGKTSVQKHFVIHEGEKNRRERIVFAPASVAAIAPSVTRPEAILATTATMAPAPPDSTITLTPSAPAGSADWRRPAKWAAFGLAAVGIGVGVVETLTAIKKSNDFNSVPDNCMDDGNGHIRGGARCEQINHDQTFATWTAAIAYGLGGALAATGLILHLGETQPAKQGHTSASVACGVSASLAGATCVGHW